MCHSKEHASRGWGWGGGGDALFVCRNVCLCTYLRLQSLEENWPFSKIIMGASEPFPVKPPIHCPRLLQPSCRPPHPPTPAPTALFFSLPSHLNTPACWTHSYLLLSVVLCWLLLQLLCGQDERWDWSKQRRTVGIISSMFYIQCSSSLLSEHRDPTNTFCWLMEFARLLLDDPSLAVWYDERAMNRPLSEYRKENYIKTTHHQSSCQQPFIDAEAIIACQGRSDSWEAHEARHLSSRHHPWSYVLCFDLFLCPPPMSRLLPR